MQQGSARFVNRTRLRTNRPKLPKTKARKEQTLPGEAGRSAKSLAIILIVHLVVILLWQVTVDAFHVPKFILPSPLAALVTLAHPNYAWVSNLLVTAIEILGGFLLGAAVGVALAVIFTWSRLVALLLLPLFVTLNMIPKVAMGPLVIVWFRSNSRLEKPFESLAM